MNPFRSGATFLITLIIAINLSFYILTEQTRASRQSIQQELSDSLRVVAKVKQINEKLENPTLMQELQDIRSNLRPKEREMGLSNVIQAVHTDTRRLFPIRLKEFVDNEALFQGQRQQLLEFQYDRTQFFWNLFLILNSLALVSLSLFLQNRFFSPLEKLAKQMADFSNGKYSYQFEVPGSDEVGRLQTSFNSVAQQILRNMDELRTLDKAKTEFLNIASHELRTPMTSIKGSLGLMSSGIVGELPNEAKALVTIAESETDRLIRLINDILDMAKIEAGRLSLNRSWHPLQGIVKNTTLGLKGFSEHLKVEIEALPCPSFDICVDADRIHQVLTNLLSNAVKFSPVGGKVWVRTGVNDQGHVLFEVIDQGRGISPEDQKQIFQKFRQATTPDNPLVKGTGLGLSIARAIVEQHGGLLGLTSQPGQGSTFWFSIPECRAAQLSDSSAPSALSSADSTSKQPEAA